LGQPFALEGELLERLAEAAHDAYRAGKERDGWTYGPVRDNTRKQHPLLIPYSRIPETYKEANRATVRNIPRKLAAIGCVIAPARAQETPRSFTAEEVEALARVEHQLWREERIAAGFTLGEPTDDYPDRSPYLIPWEELPEEIRQIDRDMVLAIPDILARAGCTFVQKDS
jgi:hypothetical protein